MGDRAAGELLLAHPPGHELQVQDLPPGALKFRQPVVIPLMLLCTCKLTQEITVSAAHQQHVQMECSGRIYVRQRKLCRSPMCEGCPWADVKPD